MESIFYKIYDSLNDGQKACLPDGKLPLKIYVWVNHWGRSKGIHNEQWPRELLFEIRSKLYMIHKEKRGSTDVLIQQDM